MKLKLALLATFTAVAMPLLASAQSVDLSRAPITDSQRAATGHVELRHITPDLKRKSPLVYGFINMDGTTASSGGAFTSTYNPSANWYQITITGTSYFYSAFSTVVTPSLPAGAICKTDSVSGNLLVICYNAAGAQIQAEFGFITF